MLKDWKQKNKETKKELKELEIKKIDELEESEKSLKFLAIKTRFWGRPNNSIKTKRTNKKNTWHREIWNRNKRDEKITNKGNRN